MSTLPGSSPDAPSGPAGIGSSVGISVNGEPRRVPAGTALDHVVASLTRAASGVAAAVNETVVPRGQWPSTPLGEGDRVEIVTAVQGG